MTHRNPYRRDLDAANLRRRASFARDRQTKRLENPKEQDRTGRKWIEVWRKHARIPGPFVQDVTGWPAEEIDALCSAIEITGGTWTIKHKEDLK